jgi:hypothetical protein
MKAIVLQLRTIILLVVSGAAILCLTPSRGGGAQFGRLSGTVTDTLGNPLMGATVLIIGPILGGTSVVGSPAERVITDMHGKFGIERLVPGWYSLRVSSATRLPVVRSGVRVEAGDTVQEKFILSDLLAPIRFQVPSQSVSTWSDDWKWVLRTSASTRPVLRYRDDASAASARRKSKAPRLASRRLVAMMPGSARREVLANDPGVGSVLAYLRSLSANSDVLVAGSMATNGVQASSLAASLRRNLMRGDPQELTLVVRQLSLAEGLPFVGGGDDRQRVRYAQGLAVTYSHTRQLSDSLGLTAGFELDYLNAVQDAKLARPRLRLLYQLNPSTALVFQYGVERGGVSDTLLERVGMLQSFPRVTMRGFRPRLEQLNHAEISFHRRLSKDSQVELGVYGDGLQNAAVYGLGSLGGTGWQSGNILANPVASGWVLNVGDYRSAGFRAAYTAKLASHMEAAFAYALGDALTVDPAAAASQNHALNSRGLLYPARSHTVAGRFTAQIPKFKTQITTSYQWMPRDRVTLVDPYGQANLQMQPYLGIQIRQPLPALAFLPARIEALADFRNLLAQGYVPLTQAGDNPVILTSAYRSFRGGFSVQF